MPRRRILRNDVSRFNLDIAIAPCFSRRLCIAGSPDPTHICFESLGGLSSQAHPCAVGSGKGCNLGMFFNVSTSFWILERKVHTAAPSTGWDPCQARNCWGQEGSTRGLAKGEVTRRLAKRRILHVSLEGQRAECTDEQFVS